MNETIGTQAGLMDIEAPLAPPAHDGTGLILGITVLAAVAGVLWIRRRYRRSRRGVARRELARLERRLLSGETGARMAAYDLAAILRRALGEHRVTARRAPALRAGDAAQWRNFTHALDSARYARPDPPHDGVAALVRDARRWLGPRP